MPTSLHCEAEILDVITHVPTAYIPAKLDLYTIEPIPFVLPLPVQKEKYRSYVWTVDYGHRIIVTNQDKSGVYEIDKGQMNDRTLLGTTY